MKITDLKCYLVEIDWDDRPGSNHPRNLIKREFVFVQIDTDEGITGWGEITNYPGNIGNRAIQKYVTEIKDFLVGWDPTKIEEIWNGSTKINNRKVHLSDGRAGYDICSECTRTGTAFKF